MKAKEITVEKICAGVYVAHTVLYEGEKEINKVKNR